MTVEDQLEAEALTAILTSLIATRDYADTEYLEVAAYVAKRRKELRTKEVCRP